MQCKPSDDDTTIKAIRKKEDEKLRSKANRQHFKSLIEQLNNCVSDTKLNKNSTLEIAVALVKLDTFYNPKQISAKATTYKNNLDVNQFLNITNSVGIGFLKSGIIMYATEQLQSYFKEIKNLIGSHLSKISYNSEDIIKRVWVDNQTSFCIQVKGNYKAKSAFDICINGKRMYSSRCETMFLGYSKIKPFTMFKNPSLAMTGCYQVTNLDLHLVKSHPYIDYLLNNEMSGTPSAMWPHPDDFDLAPFNELMKTGFAECNIRLLRMEPGGSHRYVHCVITMTTFKDVLTDVTQIGSLVWPYAITKEGQHFTGNDLEMLNMNPVLSQDLNAHKQQFTTAVVQSEGIFGQSVSQHSFSQNSFSQQAQPDYENPKPSQAKSSQIVPSFSGMGNAKDSTMPAYPHYQDVMFCCESGQKFEQFPSCDLMDPSGHLIVKIEPELAEPPYHMPASYYNNYPPVNYGEMHIGQIGPKAPCQYNTAYYTNHNHQNHHNSQYNALPPTIHASHNIIKSNSLKSASPSSPKNNVPAEPFPKSRGSPVSDMDFSECAPELFDTPQEVSRILDDYWSTVVK